MNRNGINGMAAALAHAREQWIPVKPATAIVTVAAAAPATSSSSSSKDPVAVVQAQPLDLLKPTLLHKVALESAAAEKQLGFTQAEMKLLISSLQCEIYKVCASDNYKDLIGDKGQMCEAGKTLSLRQLQVCKPGATQKATNYEIIRTAVAGEGKVVALPYWGRVITKDVARLVKHDDILPIGCSAGGAPTPKIGTIMTEA